MTASCRRCEPHSTTTKRGVAAGRNGRHYSVHRLWKSGGIPAGIERPSSPARAGTGDDRLSADIIEHFAFAIGTTPCSPTRYSSLLLFRFSWFQRSRRTFLPNLRLHRSARSSASTPRRVFRYTPAASKGAQTNGVPENFPELLQYFPGDHHQICRTARRPTGESARADFDGCLAVRNSVRYLQM